MTNISKVIGWKFDDQQGMRCKEINGVMTIIGFPSGIPSQADQDLWTQEYNAWLNGGGEALSQPKTRRLFKMLLTDAMEDAIKAEIQSLPRGPLKREFRAWWENEQNFRWDDETMVKMIARLDPATVADIETAWIT